MCRFSSQILIKMKIDDVIAKLEEYKKQHGNIEVRVAGSHEYWGTVYNEVDEYTLKVHENTQLSPKKFEQTKSVEFWGPSGTQCPYYGRTQQWR